MYISAIIHAKYQRSVKIKKEKEMKTWDYFQIT